MSFFNGLKSKLSWGTGFIIGMMFSSIIVFAALTIPNQFTDGDVISSSEMNANFTAIVNALNKTPYGFLLTNSIDVNVSASQVMGPIGFDTVAKDNTGGAYSTGSSIFTVPAGEGGFYTFYYSVKLSSCASCKIYLRYRINGGSDEHVTDIMSTTANPNSRHIFLNDSDTFEIRYAEGNGVAATIDSAQTILALVRVI